jgi:hypothetical protein
VARAKTTMGDLQRVLHWRGREGREGRSEKDDGLQVELVVAAISEATGLRIASARGPVEGHVREKRGERERDQREVKRREVRERQRERDICSRVQWGWFTGSMMPGGGLLGPCTSLNTLTFGPLDLWTFGLLDLGPWTLDLKEVTATCT